MISSSQLPSGDKNLCREVESLIASYERAENFIESPAFEVAPELLSNDRAAALVGELIGHYRIESLIGAGGMGDVYLASDITAGRKAALKLLPMRFTGDAERLKRFQQEAHAVVGLNHPNILTVYEVGEARSRQYIASELIEGETLRQRLARGSMQLGEAVEIAIQVTGALAAAHKAGIVHRDVKPENVMLRPDGYVKVLDFGIAKLAEQEVPATMAEEEAVLLVETNVESILGTVRYMSPEQARGAPVDERTDIWSLGAVLYEMATGRTPFTGDTPREVMAAILATEPPPLRSYMAQTPSELQQIVSKALRKDSAERYQSANEMLEALKGLRRKLELTAELERAAARHPWLRWTRSPAALVLTLLAGALALALFYWLRNPTRNPTPEKSIAVLPFSDLSQARDQEYFCDGIQDEILTDLAKIADLKVISRVSVLQYKSGSARNLRQIGRELGVAHVLEGSVQRAANRVHVSAQLLDARTDRHVWGQTYDRDLADVFAIQSEIAKTIADQLQAKLSPSEKSAIERAPTSDISAFELHTHAKNLLLTTSASSTVKANLLEAVDLLNRAVARDPSFFDVYCELAWAHDLLYFFGVDHTPARLAAAEAAVQAAFRLRPDAGETHLARARNFYWGYLDYDSALAELEVAHRTLPNDPRVFESKGYIERRQGRWEESIRDLAHVIELDPKNFFTLQQAAQSYQRLRRYAEEKSALERVLTFEPDDAVTKVQDALAELNSKGDTRPLHQIIEAIRTTNPAAVPSIADNWLICALAERDAAAGENALIAFRNPITFGSAENILFNRPFVEGVIARMTKDDGKARSAFAAARLEQEKTVQAQPNYGPAMCVLGLIDAGLGRKEEALREGRRAVELLPVGKDAMGGSDMVKYLAMIAAWVDNKDLACEQLAIVIRSTSTLSYGQLKLLPFWDPLRGDPRFEKIVASLAPKLVEKRAPDKSIAVLPFENLSRDPDNAYFAEGIQEEILTRLAKVADLKVISRTSTQRYQSKPGNLSEIANQLGVANILEGSVQKTADQVRVNVQLVNAQTDSHLWAETYDRKLTDIFGVESEIAKGIAESLQAKLTGAEKRLIAAQPTSNMTAYELYLKGRSHWGNRSGDNIPKAIAFYEQAIARDPNYAPAYAGLSEAYVLLPGYTATTQRDAYPKAKTAALKALQLDETLGEAHNALAEVLLYGDLNMAGSISEFQRAIALNPNYATAHQWYGADPLTAIGRFDEAIAEGKRAVELDPLSPIINADFGWILAQARRYDEAIAQLRKTLEIDPTFYYAHYRLGVAFQFKGDIPAAIAEYTKAQQLSDDLFVPVLLAAAKAQSGDKDAALRMLAELEELSRHRHVHGYWRALLCISLENHDKAIRWLEQSIADREGDDIAWIKVDPMLDPLRGDPSFEALVQKVVGAQHK
jgi:TolB-like protein/Tfp pilus assembly protein PilF